MRKQLIGEFRDMATGKLDLATQPHHLGRLTVFAGVRDLPTRVKCAILPWHTLHAALNSVASVRPRPRTTRCTLPIGNARARRLDQAASASSRVRNAKDRRNRADAEPERDEVRAEGAADLGHLALVRQRRRGEGRSARGRALRVPARDQRFLRGSLDHGDAGRRSRLAGVEAQARCRRSARRRRRTADSAGYAAGGRGGRPG